MARPLLRSVQAPVIPAYTALASPLEKPWFSGLNIEKDEEIEEEDAEHMAEYYEQERLALQERERHEAHLASLAVVKGSDHARATSTLISSLTPIHRGPGLPMSPMGPVAMGSH